MRRGVGVGAVKKKKDEVKQFQEKAKEMEETKLANVTEILNRFQSSLQDFAAKHRKRINSDPEFRLQFHKMCVSVGVGKRFSYQFLGLKRHLITLDPLASNKGFWADLLGVGDFYFELGVNIVEVCIKSRSLNGGIMSLSELHSKVRQKRGNLKQEVLREDVQRAIEKLSVLGNGFKLVQVRGREPLVFSVPMELNHDHDELLTEVQNNGFVTFTAMQTFYGWTFERFHNTIEPLLQEGMLWLDDYKGQ
jgi:ESCRT-II complex subunit VPS22